MKKMIETKTKNRSNYTQVESNTAECIVCDLCTTGMVVTGLVCVTRLFIQAMDQ